MNHAMKVTEVKRLAISTATREAARSRRRKLRSQRGLATAPWTSTPRTKRCLCGMHPSIAESQPTRLWSLMKVNTSHWPCTRPGWRRRKSASIGCLQYQAIRDPTTEHCSWLVGTQPAPSPVCQHSSYSEDLQQRYFESESCKESFRRLTGEKVGVSHRDSCIKGNLDGVAHVGIYRTARSIAPFSKIRSGVIKAEQHLSFSPGNDERRPSGTHARSHRRS